MRFIFQYPSGDKIWVGATVPPGALGDDGDVYVRSNGDYYQKAAGSWGSPIANLTGPQGNPGATGAAGAAGASFNPGAPSVQSFASGTAFQPSATRPVALTVFAAFTALLSIAATVTVTMSPTVGGTYTTVASSNITLSLGAITIGGSLGVVIVPIGYFVKITNTGGATSTAIIQLI